MPKKDDEKHVQARELYEQDGFSLADIARKLNLNVSTVKTWKRREKWVKPKVESKSESAKCDKKRERIQKTQNPNSLANLNPPAKPGEKLALKHGFYADNSHESNYDRYYQRAMEEPINQTSRELYAKNYANTMVALEKVNPSNSAHIEAMARTGVMVTNMAEKASKIEMNELNIEEKRQHMSGNDPALELVKEYTEAFRDYANAHTETD